MASTEGGPSSPSKKVQAHEEKSDIVAQHMHERMNALAPDIAAIAERCQQYTGSLEKGVKHLDKGVKRVEKLMVKFDAPVEKLMVKFDARVEKLKAKIQHLEKAIENVSEKVGTISKEDECSSAVEDN